MSNDVQTEKYKGHTIHILPDDCPENPMEWGGQGKIHSFGRRHINHIDPDEGREILKRNPFAVALSYFEHGQCLWMVAELPAPPGVEFQWDGTRFAGVWEPDQDCIGNIKGQLWHAGITIVQHARYQHDPTHADACPWILEVAGERFDNWKKAEAHARKLAKEKDPKNYRKNALRAATLRYAAGICETYSAWCNGEVYGFSVEGALCEDSCFGFYEIEEAMSEARSAIDYAYKQHATEGRKFRALALRALAAS